MPNEPVQQPAVPQDPYLDAKRFPLTTRSHYSLHEQKMMDAINKDDLVQMQEAGKALTPVQAARLREFEEKAKIGHGAGPETPAAAPAPA